MQCANCQFQNMPGSPFCGRCGTSLTLSTATLDVHPPRAGAIARRFRKAVPVTRAYHGAVRAIAEARGVRNAIPFFTSIPEILRAIVPGWAHFHLGLRWLGHLFLWGFLVLFIPGLIYFGSSTGSIFLGLAFSVHATAVLDIVMRTFGVVGVRNRMAHSIGVTVLLAALVYWPAGWILTRVMDPRTIEQSFGSFRRGDVVFVNHWSKIKPGSIVMYSPNDVRDEAPMFGNRTHEIRIFSGPRIDRILATAGDTVLWENGQLTVNGIASKWQPLDPARASLKLSLTVPEGDFFILPTGGARLPAFSAVNLWLKLSLVPQENVTGCVYVRTQPFSRFSWIH